jgi:hypothetical protein
LHGAFTSRLGIAPADPGESLTPEQALQRMQGQMRVREVLAALFLPLYP